MDQSTVTTFYDVETYVIACLNGLHADYDVPGIVAALRETEWWPVPDRPATVLDDMPDFWEIVAAHDLRPDTTVGGQHPEWCSPDECDAPLGVHNGQRMILAPFGAGWDRAKPLEVYPSWAEAPEGTPADSPCVYFYGASEGPLSPAEARHLAAMLVSAAAEIDAAAR